jgi:hypothetical protein
LFAGDFGRAGHRAGHNLPPRTHASNPRSNRVKADVYETCAESLLLVETPNSEVILPVTKSMQRSMKAPLIPTVGAEKPSF